MPAPIGSWSTYEYTANRSGYNDEESTLSVQNAPDLRVIWNVTFPGPLFASPTVVNGTVYEGSWDGNETALYAANGTIRWNSFLGIENFTGKTYGCPWANPLGVTSAATVVNDSVYVGSATSYYALNATTGAQRWQYSEGSASLGYYAWSSPLYFRGNLYVGISSQCDNPLVDGGLLEINASAGKLVHSLDTGAGEGGSIWSSPTLDAAHNRVWVTTGNGPYDPSANGYGQALVEVNASTLGVVASWQVPGGPNDIDFGAGATFFTAPNGTLGAVATNKDGWAYAVNRSDLSGGSMWADRLTTFPGSSICQPPGQSIAPATYDGHSLYLASSYTKINGTPVNGSVRAVNVTNGSYRWQTPTNGSVLGGLVSANGLVVDVSRRLPYTGSSGGCYSFSATNDSWLQVLNASTGAVLYQFYAPYVFSVAPSIADGRIFVAAGTADESEWTALPDHAGHLYAFGVPLNGSVSVSLGVPAPNTSALSDLFLARPIGGMPGYSCEWSDAAGPLGSGCDIYVHPPPGEINLTLLVRDAANETWNVTTPENISPTFWSVAFTAVPSTMWLGNTTYLEANSSGNGADPPLTFQYFDLPVGCLPENRSWLRCAPSAVGTYHPAVLVTGANGAWLNATTHLMVVAPPVPPPPQLTGFSIQPGIATVGEPVLVSGNVSGGAPPLSEELRGLPPGCPAMDSVNLSCTPSAPGMFNVEAVVTDLLGRVAEANASVEVLPELTILDFNATPGRLPLGSAVRLSVTLAGGAPPYAVEYLGLPPGCPSTNLLVFECTPTAPGSYNVTAEVTPGMGAPATASVDLTVYSNVPGTSTGPPGHLPGWAWEIPVAGIGLAALAVLLVIWSRRRSTKAMG